MDRFTQKILNFIKKNEMFAKGDTVVVGFSGGADSTALLNVLSDMSPVLKIRVAALHVNHGIRKEAGLDEQFCRTFCDMRDIPLKVVTADVPRMAKDLKLTEEEAGRRVRYDAFEDFAKELSAGKIAVAHHKNDVAETLLMNLSRGCGLVGAAAIKPVRDNVVRPLLCVDRKEIEDYLKGREISFCTDQTNFENYHTRNIIRNRILPLFESDINSESASHMARAAASFDRAGEFVMDCACEAFEKVAEATGDKVSIDAKALLQEKEIIRESVILLAFEKLVTARKDISASHVDAVLGLLEDMSGCASVNLPYGLRAQRTYDNLKIGFFGNRIEEMGEISLPALTDEETVVYIPGLGVAKISVFPRDKHKIVPRETYTKWFDYDRIQEVSFRQRKKGDFILFDTKDGLRQKSISKFMTDSKIPKSQRDSMYLLADRDHIIWVPGYRMSAAYKVTETTKNILSIKITAGGNSNG